MPITRRESVTDTNPQSKDWNEVGGRNTETSRGELSDAVIKSFNRRTSPYSARELYELCGFDEV